MFKKRSGSKNGSVRKRVLDDGEDEDGEEAGAAVGSIGLFKLQQNLRKRTQGMDINMKSLKVAKEGSSHNTEASAASAPSAAFGQQFESRDTIGGKKETVAHADIMEEYVRQKMGEVSGSEEDKEGGGIEVSGSSLPTALDAFALDGHVKDLVAGTTAARKRSDSVSESGPAGMGASISGVLSEVALPETVRAENMKRTEEARTYLRRGGRDINTTSAGSRDNKAGAFRFQQKTPRSRHSEASSLGKKNSDGSTPPVAVIDVPTEETIAERQVGKSKYTGPRASDHRILDNFRRRDKR